MKYVGRALSAAVIAASLFLVGCKQSPEDRIYEAFKCGKAATMLGYEKEAAQAIATIESDLKAVARADAAELAAFVAALRDGGRASLNLDARVPLPEGGSACDMRSRYVAIAKAA